MIDEMKRLTREEMEILYPDLLRSFSRIENIKVYKDRIEYTEIIDLSHPDCPIVGFDPSPLYRLEI